MPHLSKGNAQTMIDHRRPFLLVERIPIESVDKENELLRGKNRYPKLFSSYPPQAEVRPSIHVDVSTQWESVLE